MTSCDCLHPLPSFLHLHCHEQGDLYQLMVKHDGQLQEGFVACHIVAPLLSTLQLLHKLGIVHRDVKTEVRVRSLNHPCEGFVASAPLHKVSIACPDSELFPPLSAPELLHDSQR